MFSCDQHDRQGWNGAAPCTGDEADVNALIFVRAVDADHNIESDASFRSAALFFRTDSRGKVAALASVAFFDVMLGADAMMVVSNVNNRSPPKVATRLR